MEAKETAGLLMTERVARDCSSGLLETTSNRLWSAAKTNTHQLLQKGGQRRKEERRGRGLRQRERGEKKGRFSGKIEIDVTGSSFYFGLAIDREGKQDGKE